MLRKFVFDVQEIYSIKEMTFNVHLLLHMAKSVLNWGPLWTHSAFPFESENRNLLNAIKSAKGVTLQIVRHVNMLQSIKILERQVDPVASTIVKRFCDDISNKRTLKTTRITGIRYFGSGNVVHENLLMKFNLEIDKCKSFTRMVKNKCLYTSSLKSNTRSDNSVIQLLDGRFLRIIMFIVDYERERQRIDRR